MIIMIKIQIRLIMTNIERQIMRDQKMNTADFLIVKYELQQVDSQQA